MITIILPRKMIIKCPGLPDDGKSIRNVLIHRDFNFDGDVTIELVEDVEQEESEKKE